MKRIWSGFGNVAKATIIGLLVLIGGGIGGLVAVSGSQAPSRTVMVQRASTASPTTTAPQTTTTAPATPAPATATAPSTTTAPSSTTTSTAPTATTAPATTTGTTSSTTTTTAPALVTVPNVVGMSKAAAEATLTAAGFSYSVSLAEPGCTTNVIDETPTGEQGPGTVISLGVQAGPASEPRVTGTGTACPPS